MTLALRPLFAAALLCLGLVSGPALAQHNGHHGASSSYHGNRHGGYHGGYHGGIHRGYGRPIRVVPVHRYYHHPVRYGWYDRYGRFHPGHRPYGYRGW
jgi:hypothetical protein